MDVTKAKLDMVFLAQICAHCADEKQPALHISQYEYAGPVGVETRYIPSYVAMAIQNVVLERLTATLSEVEGCTVT